MRNAMIIDPGDNVVVAIEEIKKGETVSYVSGEREIRFAALEDITIFHKAACRDIAAGEPVCKYGEHIGIASRDIAKGEHVHEHNVESRREDLDR